MNDRFRFRVWYESKGITRDKPIMIYNAEDTYDCMAGEPVIIYKRCFGDVLEDEDYIVMQCTGLKDKNGKLIYEGDIVKIFSTFYNKNFIDVVEWDNPHTRFNFGRLGEISIYNFTETWEVIGNIYENKSLLESER